MKKLLFASLMLAVAIDVAAQGSLSNQVLRLLSRINTWSALQTYDAPNGGVVLLGRQSAPLVTRTDRLENIGGNLYFNGVVLQSSVSSGTVTSVALSAPAAVFDIAGSPVTSSGTLAITFDTQSANRVFAGPTTGSAATPTFRAVVNADLPTSGVSAATYPKVTVNAQGIVTAGATQITASTDITGVVPFANGGTNLSAAADDTVMVSTGSAWAAKTLSNCVSGLFSYVTASNAFGCATYAVLGTTGAPASTNIRLKQSTNGVLSVRLGDDSAYGAVAGSGLALGSALDVTFANSNILNVFNTYTGANPAAAMLGSVVDYTLTPSGNLTRSLTGMWSTVRQTAHDNSSGLIGMGAFARWSSSGTAASTTGIDNEVFVSGTGTVTLNYGQYSYAEVAAGSTITTNNGMYIDSPGGAGTITNNYGLYVADQTFSGATVNYALFYNGAATWGVNSAGKEIIGTGGGVYFNTAAGPSLTSASGAPGGACVTGSMYSRTDGGAATSVYFCDNTAWSPFGTPSTAVLSPAKGGTGFDGSAAANGRLAIGNGSGFTLAGLTGTANQVVVSNGAGTITLSTPQAIATGSTPQFARLGLGTGAGASAVITTTGTFDTGYYNAGNTSAALSLNLLNGMMQKMVMTADCTFTITNPVAGTVYTLVLVQDGTGSRLATWPGTVTWAGGVAPTLTTAGGKADIIRLIWNGSAYYGNVLGANY